MAFEISIFPGDPNLGASHDGTMFSVRMEDGRYYKSTRAFITPAEAALAAAVVATSAAEGAQEEGRPVPDDGDADDPTLHIEGCQFSLRCGRERYTLVLLLDGPTASFILEQHTPRESPEGVIDADPQGAIEIGPGGGFIPRYSEGWEPPARLQAIVAEALDSMGAAARPGHLKPRAPGASDAN